MLFPQFHFFCWFAAFNFGLAVLFLLLTSFIVCQAILDCLSSSESLILSIWFLCILFVLLDICLLIDIVPFLVLWPLSLLGSSYRFWRQFTCAHFSLSASHGTLYLILGFVGIHFATASRCALTKFSYTSFGLPFSVFSCSVSNLFLNSYTYLSLISLLLRRTNS